MADGGGSNDEGGRGGGGTGGGGGNRSRSPRRPTMVEVVAYLDSAMAHGTVMQRLELESTVGHWLSDWMTRNRAEEHARWLAQADNNTGGVTPVRDAGGGGGAVPDAEAAPEPEAQAQAEAQLPVQLPDAQTEETQLPAGDGGAHAEPWPTCRRFGCRYLRHRQNGFAGFCCGRCRDPIRWGHGPQCQKIQWRSSADDESPFGPGGLTQVTCAPQ